MWATMRHYAHNRTHNSTIVHKHVHCKLLLKHKQRASNSSTARSWLVLFTTRRIIHVPNVLNVQLLYMSWNQCTHFIVKHSHQNKHSSFNRSTWLYMKYLNVLIVYSSIHDCVHSATLFCTVLVLHHNFTEILKFAARSEPPPEEVRNLEIPTADTYT